MIGRAGGRDCRCDPASLKDVITRTLANSGRYLVTGSSTPTLPSSTSIISRERGDRLGHRCDRKIGVRGDVALVPRIALARRVEQDLLIAVDHDDGDCRGGTVDDRLTEERRDREAACSGYAGQRRGVRLRDDKEGCGSGREHASHGIRRHFAILERPAQRGEAIICCDGSFRCVVRRAVSGNRNHPVDARLRPAARVLLELHPARHVSRDRPRLPDHAAQELHVRGSP